MRTKSRFLLTLLLVPALACGPVGCGMEAALPTIVALATTATVVAIAIHEFQRVESASLDNEMKRLRLQGMRNGIPVTIEHPLTDDEYRKISETGKVQINGQEVLVGLRDGRGFTP